MYEFLSKIVAGIPTAVSKWFIIPGLCLLGVVVYRDHEELALAKQERAIQAARIDLLVETIRDQTGEIRKYREALEASTRETQAWVLEQRRKRP